MARPYRVEVPLRWSDMDAYGHVNNVQYLRLLEDARVVGELVPRDDPHGGIVDMLRDGCAGHGERITSRWG